MRYLITLAYNGTAYHGWQYQPNAITVQEVLERCFSVVLRQNISITGAGRTDTGVHASFYAAHFNAPEIAHLDSFVNKMNAFLPKDIALFAIKPVDDDFNARFSAKKRSYRYQIHTTKDPFLEPLSWYYPYRLNLDLMNQACTILQQHTDFASFCKSGGDNKTTICHIFNANWQRIGNQILFQITADRFLRNMVRAIVGTMVEIGAGKTTLQQLQDIIKSKNRSNAGSSVPAKGLFLTAIEY